MSDDRRPSGARFDPYTPSTARMYDFYLGGKDNYAADREAALEVLRKAPSIREAARNNRHFLARTVDYCASAGITQFIDIGTGIPTYPNVCDVARNVHPEAVVVGVDDDPVVLAHDRALLNNVEIINGDMRQPLDIINDPLLNAHIDWRKPVAVLFVAVLHFMTEAEDPAEIIAAFRRRMAPGSRIVISHVCSTGANPAEVAEVERIYQRSTSPGAFRAEKEILRLFDGFELLDPGLVPVQDWPWRAGLTTAIPVLGGVGHKPASEGRA